MYFNRKNVLSVHYGEVTFTVFLNTVKSTLGNSCPYLANYCKILFRRELTLAALQTMVESVLMLQDRYCHHHQSVIGIVIIIFLTMAR